MKYISWFDKKPEITIKLDLEAALWLLDHLPTTDTSRSELRQKIHEVELDQRVGG